MLRYFFRSKKKLSHHQMVIENSFHQYSKNRFLRRYITILILATLYMICLNGYFHHNRHWTYFFALSNQNKFITLNSNSVAQPFTQQEIVDYANSIVYKFFSVTPQTSKDNYNQLFSQDFVYNKYITDAYNAINKSGLVNKLNNGWYFSVEKLSEPTIKIGYAKVRGHASTIWTVEYPNFILYGRKGDQFSKTQAELKLLITKTPFLKSPRRLSVIRIFLSNALDIGSRYGY